MRNDKSNPRPEPPVVVGRGSFGTGRFVGSITTKQALQCWHYTLWVLQYLKTIEVVWGRMHPIGEDMGCLKSKWKPVISFESSAGAERRLCSVRVPPGERFGAVTFQTAAQNQSYSFSQSSSRIIYCLLFLGAFLHLGLKKIICT